MMLGSPAGAMPGGGGGSVATSPSAPSFWRDAPRAASSGVGVAASGVAALVTRLQHGMSVSLRLLRFGFGGKLPDERTRLVREQGRQVLNFPVREAAPGVFVHVSGEIEFERADIGFADGSVESVDTFGVDRDSGLYELASFGNARSIEWVRLVLRARSSRARVGIKLAG